MSDFTADTFRQVLNQPFSVRLGSGEMYVLTLCEVHDLGEPGESRFRKPFSLIFRNPDRGHFLAQRTYRFEQAQLGEIEIFVVPLGPDDQGMRYEAVFG